MLLTIYSPILNPKNYIPPEGFDQKHDGAGYGEMTEVEYYSNTTGNTRKCYVYTPPNYDPIKTYPLLYLLHGIGGTHSEWLSGSPNELLSNLIASGEAPPTIAGLSMGGREALFIGVSMPEVFGYIGAFCPAPELVAPNLDLPGQITPAKMTLPDEFKNNTFILINAGNQDGVVGDSPLNYSKAFGDNGIRYVYYSIDGGHDFGVWKNGLYYFAKFILNT